jgi:hypothetical protein
MRLAAYIVVFILLAQLVLAGEIFNDEVKDNVPFEVNDVTHIARYYPSAKKVSILAGTERILVAVAECENLGPLKYCIESAAEGVDEDTGGPASTMQLTVSESGPEIDISREISTDEPDLNEEVEIVATITNTGNERATNINYEDKFPSSVKVSSAFYNVATNGVLWTGSLDPGKSQAITYKIRFGGFITYESAAEASLIYNNKVSKFKSDAETFTVQKPFQLTESISATSVDIAEEVTYTISINNTDAAQDITVNKIQFTLPAGSVVSRRDVDIKDVEGKPTFSGKISASGSKTLSIAFKSSKSGMHQFIAKADLRVGDQSFVEEFKHDIGIGISAILPEITFNPETVKGGSELEIEAKITNFANSTVTGISLDMGSDIVDIRGWRDLGLEAGKHYYAFNKIITAPAIDEEKVFFIKLSGSYTTASGKKKEYELIRNVTVTPQEKVVELTADKVVEGKDVNITLKVKNVASYKLAYVSLIDSFPSGFRMTAGERDVDIDELGIGEEKVAYSYIVKVPDSYTKPSFDITHTFNALDKDEKKVMTEKKTTIVLGGAGIEAEPEAEEQANVTSEQAAANETAEAGAEETEKPGIFRRVWGWIKGLFTSDEEEEKFE